MWRIFYRWSARATADGRPSWYSDAVCAGNAIAAFAQKPEAQLTLVTDGTEITSDIAGLPWPERALLPAESNSAAFLRCLQFALERSDPGDWIYLLEEDYLHRDHALAALADGALVAPDGYVTLFDDPLYYWPSRDCAPVDQRTTLRVGLRHHWRRVPSTTMTFAGPAWALAEDAATYFDVLRGHAHPPDQYLWKQLTRHREIFCCLPGHATHVERTALAPLTNWAQLNADASASRGLQMNDASRPVADDPFATLHEVAISENVDPAARSALAGLVDSSVTISLEHSPDRYDHAWIALAASEKADFDSAVRNRRTKVHGVIVCDSTAGQFSGRWFSGRDWFLAELLAGRRS
jgi:hypothetical protein